MDVAWKTQSIMCFQKWESRGIPLYKILKGSSMLPDVQSDSFICPKRLVPGLPVLPYSNTSSFEGSTPASVFLLFSKTFCLRSEIVLSFGHSTSLASSESSPPIWSRMYQTMTRLWILQNPTQRQVRIVKSHHVTFQRQMFQIILLSVKNLDSS